MDQFLKAYIRLCRGYWQQLGYKSEWAQTVTFNPGKRYTKLLVDGAARAFIDTNGDVYMAASWSKPAKHVRGNIYSPQHGMEAFGASGHVRYLK